HAREDGGGDEERGVERRCADEDLPPDPEKRFHLAEARSPRLRVGPEELDDERDSHSRLRDRRAGCRARDPPMEAVDEEHLEHEVEDVRRDDDLERSAEVRDTAQVALARERNERSRQSGRGDPEVDEREMTRLAVAAQPFEQRRGDDLAPDEERNADAERRAERLRRRAWRVVRGYGAGHAGTAGG